MMKRTQLYLPLELHRRVAREASRRNCSVAKLVRETLDNEFGKTSKKKGAAGLLKIIEHAKELEKRNPTPADGPKDLSANHDFYLYGEGRIE